MAVRFVEIGEIVNVVGLRGELKLLVNGNYDERILESPFLRLRGRDGIRPVRCRRHRPKGGTVVVSLAEVADRNAAEGLVGGALGFEAADYDAPGFPRGKQPAPFVYLDLEVVTTGGEEIGRVEDVWVLPANWVLRVLGPAPEGDDEREILVPVIDSVIREVDRPGGRVVIEPIPGLLDDEEFA